MIKDILNICMVQVEIVWENKKNNLLRIDQLLNSNDVSPDLIILPEMFSTGFTMSTIEMAESGESETIEWMREKARVFESVITGSIIFKDQNRFYNRLIWMNPDGRWQYYDKRHLFVMGGESKHYSPGKNRLIADLYGWKVYPLICYDLRFPVWSRNCDEYDLLIYIASWPASRRIVWDTLLRARAIENQAYVCGVNRIGKDNDGIIYNGGTTLIDPKGNEISLFTDNEEETGVQEISMPVLKKFRKNFPVLKDRDNFSLSF